MRLSSLRVIILALAVSAAALVGLTAPVHAEGQPSIEYTVTYVAEGAESVPAPVTFLGFEEYGILEITDLTPMKDGFIFTGWSTSPSFTDEFYPGDHITLTSRASTLYAIFAPVASDISSEDVMLVPDSESLSALGDSETAEPLGVSTTSSKKSSHMYSFAASMAVAAGVLFVAALTAATFAYIYRTSRD